MFSNSDIGPNAVTVRGPEKIRWAVSIRTSISTASIFKTISFTEIGLSKIKICFAMSSHRDEELSRAIKMEALI